MLHIQTAEHMTEVDRLTTETYGIKGLILMENASAGAGREIAQFFGPVDGKSIRVFCGKGNNGGDGAALARQLWMRGAKVEVLLFGKREVTRGDARVNFDIISRLAETETKLIHFKEIISETDFKNLIQQNPHVPDLHIDALFGTGLKRGLTDIYEPVIAYINECRSRKTHRVPVCSLDLPSGLAADQGNPIGPVVEADLTVTFTAPKLANVLPPACDYNGELRVVAIGSPKSLTRSAGKHKSWLHFVEAHDVKRMLGVTRRRPGAHKGSVGHVLLAAGARGKTGAAALAGEAALRAGTGLVTVALPRSAQHMLVASCLPEVMTFGAAETERGIFSESAAVQVLELAAERTVLAIGPGISSEEEDVRLFVRHMVEKSQKPVVIDADGLNCLSPWPAELKGTPERPLILTPHPGEMARLTGLSTKTLIRNRHDCVRALATEHHLHVVLKGQRTLIAAPNGEVYINPTGNAGMATGGSGDVLTGLLAGLLAQSPGSPLESTLIAVYLHGLAGDKAAAKLGMRSMVASDITAALSDAFWEMEPSS
ncbi:MAG TPA: NAD(P)H-hydrate dehydratase [Acidobacteriota bacterium]|nr:NAD(P)H-hydrate dehydratase [Acidobacteriota bacterium]HNB72340.1 NAD(P)H-hydrate dehydratase [Acidobacteriota bacterium]HNG91363.1 NAD(P)H-hydrate dehydratase [Acidobacteriota bacterium]HNH81785.1 NAD(P)H-hydrate dehydratase [Acidobacteriota bacterium]